MVSLIVPAAGKSSRFHGKPKWIRTCPNGNLMLQECIVNLDLSDVDAIYITLLKEHINQHCNDLDVKSLFKFVQKPVHILLLDHCTSSQPETIVKTIENFHISGSIFIKDVDSFFNAIVPSGNYISCVEVDDYQLSNISNKSFLQVNSENTVVNIVEKRIVSNIISVGGYGFQDTNEFLQSYYTCTEVSNLNKTELFTSHIIYHLLTQGNVFNKYKVSGYIDVGTEKEWLQYKQEFKTYFVDIDGTLFYNASEHLHPIWGQSEPLLHNIESIKKMYQSGKCHIVLTTARKETFRESTIHQLKKYSVPFHDIIFNLPHCQRVLINDFSDSNPYPSAVAINIKRDNDDLHLFLR